MNCKQTEELLPLYTGRDLEEKHAILVTEHLKTCAGCARLQVFGYQRRAFLFEIATGVQRQ